MGQTKSKTEPQEVEHEQVLKFEDNFAKCSQKITCKNYHLYVDKLKFHKRKGKKMTCEFKIKDKSFTGELGIDRYDNIVVLGGCNLQLYCDECKLKIRSHNLNEKCAFGKGYYDKTLEYLEINIKKHPNDNIECSVENIENMVLPTPPTPPRLGGVSKKSKKKRSKKKASKKKVSKKFKKKVGKKKNSKKSKKKK